MVGGSGIYGEPVAGMGLEEQLSVASLTVSSIPGLLTLCPSRAEVLVAREPLHQLYTLENQPFARYTTFDSSEQHFSQLNKSFSRNETRHFSMS